MIYVKILERVTVSIGYLSQLQYNFSPVNRWTIGEINSYIRRYAERLCYKFSWKLGYVYSIDEICL